MYKTCPPCEFYTPDTESTACPNCNGPLRVTMLAPSGAEAPDAEISEADAALLAPRCETLELPVPVRFGQVVGGVLLFFGVSRWGARILELMVGGAEITTFAQAAYVFACTALIYVMASLLGGGLAGACSVNWVPQGIGVGVGVFLLPILVMIIFMPASLPLFFLGILVTTPLTVLGAFMGHKAIRPSQFLS